MKTESVKCNNSKAGLSALNVYRKTFWDPNVRKTWCKPQCNIILSRLQLDEMDQNRDVNVTLYLPSFIKVVGSC